MTAIGNSALAIGLLIANGCDARVQEVKSELPLASLECRVATEDVGKFRSTLGDFADRSGFAVRFGYARPDRVTLTIQMWREDIKVIGTNAFAPGDFVFSAYATDRAVPPSKQLVKELITAMSAELSRTANCVAESTAADSDLKR